jgi:hypothetical protein
LKHRKGNKTAISTRIEHATAFTSMNILHRRKKQAQRRENERTSSSQSRRKIAVQSSPLVCWACVLTWLLWSDAHDLVLQRQVLVATVAAEEHLRRLALAAAAHRKMEKQTQQREQ